MLKSKSCLLFFAVFLSCVLRTIPNQTVFRLLQFSVNRSA